MNWSSHEAIAFLSYLLPGFVAAWVFHGLTPYALPAPFERVVKALIFTMLVQGIVVPVREGALLLGRAVEPIAIWSSDCQLVASLVIAVCLGLAAARYANNDAIHRVLRKWSFTRQTSYSSEWFWAFAENPTYVVLHLEDGRRLYGWPEQWPSSPETGHFALTEAEWLTGGERLAFAEIEHLLIPVPGVKMVEFIRSGNLSMERRAS